MSFVVAPPTASACCRASIPLQLAPATLKRLSSAAEQHRPGQHHQCRPRGASASRPRAVDRVRLRRRFKGILATSVAIGEFLPFKINAFNAGYASAGTVTADIYLTPSFDVLSGTYIGSILLGDLNANSFIMFNTNLAVPTFVPPGNYYVGWRLRGTNAQYGTDNDTALITKDQVHLVGLKAVLTNPNTVVGGTSSTGLVQLTGPAPPNGVGDGIDVLLSSSGPAAQFVNFVHIKQGFTSGAFNITSAPVKQNTTVTITANLHGITRTTSLLITPKAGPAALNSLALGAAVGRGRQQLHGHRQPDRTCSRGRDHRKPCKLQRKGRGAEDGSVPAGSAMATFQVKTTAVTAMAAATIKATYSGFTKTAVLSIKPLQPAAATLAPPAGSLKAALTPSLPSPPMARRPRAARRSPSPVRIRTQRFPKPFTSIRAVRQSPLP